MRQFLLTFLAFAFLRGSASPGQNAPVAPAKPDQHIVGTIAAADAASRHIAIKQDKTGTEYAISLEKTRTLLKVEPGAKDLKTATRITPNDLAVGDRVDIRGFKAADNPTSIAAASLILMSARDLQQARQAEANDWRQRGIAGTVTSVDTAGLKLNINVRTPAGPKPLVVDIPQGTQFTRYAPDNPKTPVPSKLADIQPGDQVRVLGNKTPDESAITAEKIYSGSFRTVAGSVSSIAPGGNEITVTDLQTKQAVQVVLTADSAIRKLPPPLAMMLARHVNPNFRSAESAANTATPAGSSTPGAKAGEPQGAPEGVSAGSGGRSNKVVAAANGDVSQMIERLPKMAVSDLKPGDAVIVSGAAGADKSQLVATNVIAGVEPIFQSAPSRQGRSPGGDWSLDMAIPSQ
ncbi:MAG: hypothetical protein ACR2JB_18300 [Bryobacteraceae bacterium]